MSCVRRGAWQCAWLTLLVALLLACSDDTSDSEGSSGPRVDAATLADATFVDGRLCAACDGSCEETLTLEPAAHRAGPIDYADKPPAGGPHAPCWANYAAYVDAPLPAEQWVHNLEHGAVVFLYHCPDGCDAELAQLIALQVSLPRAIVTEYPQMPAGFAALSWGKRLVSSCYDETALRSFYELHFDRAPESIGSGKPSGC